MKVQLVLTSCLALVQSAELFGITDEELYDCITAIKQTLTVC